MKRTFFVLFLFLGFFQPAGLWADEPGQNRSGGAPSVETLMATLNETLAENRKIRASMGSLQDALEKMTIENNVLASQLNKIQSEKKQEDTQGREKVTLLEQQMTDLSENLKELETQNRKFDQKKKEAEERLAEIRKENKKLKGLLGNSILASERDQYVKIIGETEKAANQAVSQIAEVNLENQKLKQELTETHFHLANTFTEARYYKSAIEEYRKALLFDPSNPWIHYNIAVLYDYYLDNNEKALLHYREFLSLKPAQEKALEVRERVLDLKMLKKVIPEAPLKSDFLKLSKKDSA